MPGAVADRDVVVGWRTSSGRPQPSAARRSCGAPSSGGRAFVLEGSTTRFVRLRVVCAIAGVTALAGAAVTDAPAFRGAVDQGWSPFVLIAGLLAVGAVVHEAGLFDAIGHRVGGVRGPHTLALILMLLLVAATTAVLNLDTAAAFLTPVAVVAARRRGVRVDSFLYGTLFMTNSASLLLPGSNLTNLLVLGREPVTGARFASRMWPAFVVAVVVTAGVMVVWRWRDLGMRPQWTEEASPRVSVLAVVAVAVVAVVVVATRSPALPVFLLAVAMSSGAVAVGRVSWRRMIDAVDPLMLIGLFGLAVALGTAARAWAAGQGTLGASNRAVVVGVAAVMTVLINNLPAAAVLSARGVVHPRALLLGLNLGPNLAVTGSLSAFVWIKVARAVDAEPDWRQVTRIGLVLVPL